VPSPLELHIQALCKSAVQQQTVLIALFIVIPFARCDVAPHELQNSDACRQGIEILFTSVFNTSNRAYGARGNVTPKRIGRIQAAEQSNAPSLRRLNHAD